MPSLTFLSQNTYSLAANGQIWPRTLNGSIRGSSNYIYLVIKKISMNHGYYFNFVLGYAFLERFYTVYDATSNRIGIAITPWTTVVVN